MKVRFILSFLAALFIAGNMIAIESTERVERKLPLVLKRRSSDYDKSFYSCNTD